MVGRSGHIGERFQGQAFPCTESPSIGNPLHGSIRTIRRLLSAGGEAENFLLQPGDIITGAITSPRYRERRMEDAGRRNNGFEVVLEVLRRRKWLAILTLGGVFAAAVSIVMFLPNVYRAKATLIIDRQEILEEFVKSTVTSAVETRLQTISQEVLSRSRLEGLINHFGLYTHLKERVPLEVVVERVRKDIQLELKRVERVGRDQATVAFAISFSGSDPQNVALVTNTLASFYIEENSKVREWQAVGTAQFFRVQLEEMKKRLDDQERQVSEFKELYLGELPQQQEANLATLDRLNMQLRLNGENQLRISERRAALDKQLAEARG